MIEVSAEKSACSFKMSILKERILCKCLLVITHSVRLDVCLVNYIKTVFVAERIPTRIIRIVACSYSIHIEFLHDEDILDHILL